MVYCRPLCFQESKFVCHFLDACELQMIPAIFVLNQIRRYEFFAIFLNFTRASSVILDFAKHFRPKVISSVPMQSLDYNFMAFGFTFLWFIIICVKHPDGDAATVLSDSLILELVATLRLVVRC